MEHYSRLRPTARRRLICLAIMVLLTPLGLLCRFVPLGLPQAIVKYGGSFLWAAMVYWLIAFILARQGPFVLGIITLVVTTAVEFLKEVHFPTLDLFRSTFAGKVMLGRYFSYTDIAVYWLAVAFVVWIDRATIHSRLISKD